MDLRIGAAWAIGAAGGGIVGRALIGYAYAACPDENRVGAIQAGVLLLLVLMAAGSRINRRFSDRDVNRLFVLLMAAIIGICVWNVVRFTR